MKSRQRQYYNEQLNRWYLIDGENIEPGDRFVFKNQILFCSRVDDYNPVDTTGISYGSIHCNRIVEDVTELKEGDLVEYAFLLGIGIQVYGKIIEVKNIPWGFKYIVEVTKSNSQSDKDVNLFYPVGSTLECKREMLRVIKK